jgi:hypothetical protein
MIKSSNTIVAKTISSTIFTTTGRHNWARSLEGAGWGDKSISNGAPK